MRRGISLIVAFVMFVSLFVPIQAYAESDSGLEQAIRTAKSFFEIPEKLTEFNYNVSNMQDKKIWRLSWSGKDGMDGNVSVSVDEKGKIISYDSYTYRGEPKKKLPQVSSSEAKKIAEEFIKRINPELLGQIKLKENGMYPANDTVQNFNYTRTVNGIPFDSNGVSVSVDRETGDIRSYNLNWSDDISFPAADKVISLEQAKKAFREKLGLMLSYNSSYEESIKVFPAFSLKYPDRYYIDALTGEKIKLNPNYELMKMGGMGSASMFDRSANSKASEVVLNPDEQKAVEKVSKLLKKEDVEKTARDLKELQLDSDYKLVRADLMRDWQFKEDFNWMLSFQKSSKSEEDFGNISVTANAVTGEIKNFYIGIPYKNEKAKYDETAAKTAVEAFLRNFKGSKFSESEYEENDGNTIYPAKDSNITRYSFSFIRKVNEVKVPGNSLRVDFDAVSGRIASFNMTWYDMSFPALDKALAVDNIYEKLLNEFGLELQYKPDNDNVKMTKIVPGNPSIKNVRLVYDIRKDKPVLFDAFNGNVLNYNGTPYKEKKPIQYGDISGHYAEKQVLALAEYGVLPEGKEFNPDESILQKDFFHMLSKVLNGYYLPDGTDESKALEELYRYLLREGIIKEGEKAPNANVSREEATKYIVRALKYDKVADISGIFKTLFSDEDQITPGLSGYVAIASGLGLIEGDGKNFNPLGNLSRAQAAVIIYNYLQK